MKALLPFLLLTSGCAESLGPDYRQEVSDGGMERAISDIEMEPGALAPDAMSPTANVGTCPYLVTRQNPDSWLLTQPQVHFVFWGEYWLDSNNNQSVYMTGWNTLLNGGSVLQRLAQYGVGAGSFDLTAYNLNTNLILPDPEGGLDTITTIEAGNGTYSLLTNEDIHLEINNEILANAIPAPNNNTLYVIFLPPGVISASDSKLNDCGYHSWAIYGEQKYTFAVIFDGAVENVDSCVSHEIYEAATDPQFTGWRTATGAEIADLCQVPNQNWNEQIDGTYVQQVWSQDTCVCF